MGPSLVMVAPSDDSLTAYSFYEFDELIVVPLIPGVQHGKPVWAGTSTTLYR